MEERSWICGQDAQDGATRQEEKRKAKGRFEDVVRDGGERYGQNLSVSLRNGKGINHTTVIVL